MVSIPRFQHKIDTKSKVAICVPVRDQVTSVFTYSLAMLMKRCGEKNVNVSLYMNVGSEVAMQRQQLVDQILETDATHILWLDSDMKFPADTLDILLSSDKYIVAGNYSTRVKPHRPVAFKNANNLDKRVFLGNGLEKVYAVGSGMMLVKRSVYENIPKPYYSIEWQENFTNLVGEDVYFCDKAGKHDYDVFIDHDLSKRIAHVGTKAYTIKDDCND